MILAEYNYGHPPYLGQTTSSKGIHLWHEAFGHRENPALLLVMGGLCQGILWPTEFCEELASQGFYVIRYDHRDSGLSTCFDFSKKAYDLLDMANDAIGLLNYLDIEKVHVCGLSMGGPIAELMSIHYPGRVQSLTLMATSCDLRPSSLAFDHEPIDQLNLPGPTDRYIEWMTKFMQETPETPAQQLDQRVECWSILNGSVVPFEDERYRTIHSEFLQRMRHPECLSNHLYAIKKSFKLILDAPRQVRVPTVVLHGTEDPIFPPIHGETLAKSIRDAKFVLVNGFGHIPNREFYPTFIKEIKAVAKL